MKKLMKLIASAFFLLLLVLIGFRINAVFQESRIPSDIEISNGRFVQTDEGVIHVSEWGSQNAVPIVMTHGMAAWGRLWEQTAKEISAKGYRVIAVDQPPFGFSEREGRDFSRSTQAKRIAALAKAMDLRNYLLVGHSYGGGIAMETALRYPNDVAGLVLVCPVLVLKDDANQNDTGTVPLPLRFTPLAEILVSATVTNPLMTGYLTKNFMHRKTALTGRHIEILQTPMTLKGNTRHMVLWLRQFLAGDPNAKSRSRPELANNKIPVSLIWGEKDQVTPIEQGEELSSILKPIRFSRMQDIGHMPQLEAPEEFNSKLLDALISAQVNGGFN